MALGLVGGVDNRISYNSGNEILGNGLVAGNYQPMQKPYEPITPAQVLGLTSSGSISSISPSSSAAAQSSNPTPAAGASGTVPASVTQMISPISGIGSAGSSVFDSISQALNPDDSGRKPGEEILYPETNESGTSALSNGQIDNSSGYNSANDYYMNLYKETGDAAYLEKYIDNMIERENVASARAYEERMSNTSFSRLADDIKAAGYNPWLALQSGSAGTAGSYNTSVAGHSAVSQSSQGTSKRNTDVRSMTSFLGNVLSTIGNIASSFIKAMS